MQNFIKKTLILFLSFFAITSIHANVPIEEAIKWKYEIKKINDTDAELIVTANLFHGFHLFSINHDPNKYDGTGIPTAIKLIPNGNYKTIGTIKESKTKTGSDDYGTYVWHDKQGVFKQRIKLNTTNPFDLEFTVEWQICNDVMCHIPQKNAYKIKINGDGKVLETENTISSEKSDENTITTNQIEKIQEIDKLPINISITSNKLSESKFELIYTIIGDENYKVLEKNNAFNTPFFLELKKGSYKIIENGAFTSVKYFDNTLKKELNVIPVGSSFKQIIEVNPNSSDLQINGQTSFTFISNDQIGTTENIEFTVDLAKASVSIQDESSSESYLGIFFIAFLSGFAALLTPCVFPMIPMTVSFFLKQSKTRAQGIKNAIIYGLSIIIIYVALGLGVTLIFGEQALNAMSTNVYFNLFFFVLLVVFGASFLGAFEITLPSSWVNKSDRNADKGGLIGIFFMAFTLALVSFSCTGPIIGTLLVEATSKGIMGPLFGMLGFSLALALPFALFSAFPAWLNSMPKSGGWLNSVKVVLGFLEIALAFKFLSNADLVVKAHLLEREVFIAIWIVIFTLLAFYLLGKLTFSHDSPVNFITVPRLFLSIIVFSFVMYMIPGMWGAPIKILSGFLPPQHYSEIPYGIGGQEPNIKLPEHASFGPHGIPVFHDYDDARKFAIENKKPLMIDFTGHACINCRKMEDQVWSNSDVKKILTDSVVIASLHVDEKLELSPDKQIKDENGKLLKTVGDKWSYLQKTKYGQQTQPQYIILDDNENKLTPSTSYMTDSDKINIYKNWLRNGIKKYYGNNGSIELKGSAIQIAKEANIESTSYKKLYFDLYGEEIK